MTDWEPSYRALHRSGALGERADRALALLDGRCLVPPAVQGRPPRRLARPSYFAHFGEENCLRGRRGSGTIFFSGCNLRYVFCQNTTSPGNSGASG